MGSRLENLKQLIEKTRLGKKYLERFSREAQTQSFEFCSIREVRPEGRLNLNRLNAYPAAFVTLGEAPRKIVLDFSYPDLLLAILLFHELVHATDQKLNKNYQKLEEQYNALQKEQARLSKMSQKEQLPLWRKCSRKRKLLGQKEKRCLFKAEKRAYQMQFRFVKQLMRLSPEIAPQVAMLERWYGFTLTSRLRDEAIATAHGFN